MPARPHHGSRRNTSPHESPRIPSRHTLRDGSVSAAGYFDGLNHNQAQRSMEMLQQEYEKHLLECREDSRMRDAQSPAVDNEDTLDLIEVGERGVGVRSEGKEQMQFQQIQVFWSKRNWTTAFERYHLYDGSTRLGLTEWNRLLNWIWLTLSDKHMSELQFLLQRFRTTQRMIGDITHSPVTGSPRSTFQQDLIRDYHRVVRSLSTQDISGITQRFYLTDLYRSHGAYVDQFRKSGLVLQTARQRVNSMLMKVFNNELNIEVNLQTITNQLKEGRHWNELLYSRETQHFGCGMLLLLPIRDHSEIARKCADPIWSFLLEQLSNLSPRTISLATALQPIAQAIQRKGIGNVNVPLLGYELRSAMILHDVRKEEFNNCLASYPDLNIRKAMSMIRNHGLTKDPDRIPTLVEEEYLSNQKMRKSGNGSKESPTPRQKLRNAPIERRPSEGSLDIAVLDVSNFNNTSRQTRKSKNVSSTLKHIEDVAKQNSIKRRKIDSVQVARDQQLSDLSLMPPPAQSNPKIPAIPNVATTVNASESIQKDASFRNIPSNSHHISRPEGSRIVVSKSLGGLPCRPNPPPTTVSQLFQVPSSDWISSITLPPIQELVRTSTAGIPLYTSNTTIFASDIPAAVVECPSNPNSSGEPSSITELSPSPQPELSSEDERILHELEDKCDAAITPCPSSTDIDSNNNRHEDAEQECGDTHLQDAVSEIQPIQITEYPTARLDVHTTICEGQQSLYSTVEVPRSLSPLSPVAQSSTPLLSSSGSTSDHVACSMQSIEQAVYLNQADLDGLLAELTEDEELVTNL